MTDLLVGVLLESSLRVVVIAALVAGLLAALRVRSSSVQHAAWAAVLLAMLFMPLLSSVVPSIDVPLFERPLAVPRIPAMPEAVPGWQAGALTSVRSLESGVTAESRSSVVRPTDGPRLDVSWALVLLGLYGVGAAFLLARFGLGAYVARQLMRTSEPVDARHLGTGAFMAREHALIRESAHLVVPITVGFVSPVVLLPAGWRRWPRPWLEAVLAHELAHAARRDPLVAGVAALNCCLFWFHPLAWWLKRTVAVTAEQTCDEAAVDAAGGRQSYVEMLVALAAAVTERGRRASLAGVGMHGSGLLTRRIRYVTRPQGDRGVPAPARAAVAIGCGLTILAGAACGPGEPSLAERRREVEWLIDRHPDTEVAVRQGDRPLAEEVLLARLADDPGGPWSARLGRFYAASIFGYYIPITESGPLREMTDLDPEGAFAVAARSRLAASNDPVMLTAAARFLRQARHYGGSFTEREVLAKDYLERAVQIDPGSRDARVLLASTVARERRTTQWSAERRVPPVEQYDDLATLPAAVRFEAMAQAAVDSQRAARRAARTGDRNMNRYVAVKAENARRFAEEVLALAPSFPGAPDAGLFVYQAHMTLASLAMLRGDASGAAGSLHEAGTAPAAEGLAYGQRVAAWVVVRDLVDADERLAVIDFLESMAEKSVVDRERYLTTADDVRAGQSVARLFDGFHTAFP